MIRCDETKPYIFISYSHKDSEKVCEIIGGLENAGYNVWYDGGIDPGTEWDQNIASHVKGCAYFIAFISNGYLSSENCKDEINYARDLDKDRLLVYLEEVELPDGMAMRLNRIQAIWWNRYQDLGEAYNKLFAAQGIERTKLNGDLEVSVSQSTFNVNTASFQKEIVDTSAKSKKKFPKWVGAVIVVAGLALAAIAVPSLVKGEEPDKNYERQSLDWYLAEVEAGDENAILYLADYYYRGAEGTERNYAEAVRWYKEAVECKMNLGKAYAYLGKCYHQGGNGIEKDDAEAVEWFEKALEEGITQVDDIDVYYELGYIYYHSSNTIEGNYAKAVEYYEKAVENGITNAYCYMAICYFNGDDTLEKDYKKVVELTNKAIESETTDNYEKGISWRVKGSCYYEGAYGVEQDYTMALECYKKAEALGDRIFDENPVLMGRYAVCYYEAENYDMAVEWFKKAESVGELTDGVMLNAYGECYGNGRGVDADYAKSYDYFKKASETGNIKAITNLGLSYYYGYAVKQNYEEAVVCFEKASEAGNTLATFVLGHCYYNGLGVDADYVKAVACYTKAAEDGNAEASNMLGLCYYNGDGIEQNYEKAFIYFKKSSEAGLNIGMFNLGCCYETGHGVEQDLEKATEQYQKAAALGHEGAKKALQKLQKAEE